MTLELAALKRGVAAGDALARSLVRQGLDAQATVAYTALLQTLGAMCAGEADTEHGWRRVVPHLAGTAQRIPSDALAASQLGQLQVRAAALLDLPDLVQIASLAEIHNAIAAAIQVGAPRYNAGDVAGCCTVYWATGQTLLATQVLRGFAGSAKALAPLRQVHEVEPPARMLDGAGVDAYAWTLRHAFDAALSVAG